MATVKSNLGEHPVPKPGNQGGSTSVNYKPNVVQDSNGDSAPNLGDQSKRHGVYPSPQGGSGTGSHRGDSLPR